MSALFSWASTFYLDPSLGSLDNDGSASAPWPNLQEIFDQGLIQHQSYGPLPYNPDLSNLQINNPGSPIQSGDTLILLDGLHGKVFARNFFNTDKIYFIGQSKNAIVEYIQIQGGSNLHFENISISSEPYGYYLQNKLVFFETHAWQGPCKNMDLINCEIYSGIQAWETAEEWLSNSSSGIFLLGDSMRVVDNVISNIDHGITCNGNDHWVKGNAVINFSGDGMRILGSRTIVEKNLIKNCYKVDDNHDDGIQSFNTSGIEPSDNILRSNIILNYDDPNQLLKGPLQGIGCFDGFYNNWVIENNLVIVDHYHGISLYGANNCRIINNTVIDPTPDITPGPIWIRINDHEDGTPSTNCLIANNVSNRILGNAEMINNQSLSSNDEYLLNFVDPASNDFHLLPGSLLIDAASANVAPAVDLDGNPRINPDIGAYEYFESTSMHTLASANGYSIFPNPFYNQLTIDGEKDFNFQVFNLRAELIYEGQKNQPIPEQEITNWNDGAYLLKIIDLEKTTSISKIIFKQSKD